MGKRKPGSPRIFRKPRSPYWWHDFVVDRHRYYDSTERTEKAPAQAVADARYRDAVQASRDRRRAETEPLTIERAADQWWQIVGSHGTEADLGPFSSDEKLRDRPINWLVAQVDSRKRLHEITTAEVLKVIERRRARLAFDGHDNDGVAVYRTVSNRTINRTVGKLLRRIMNWAAEALNADLPSAKQLKWSEVILEERAGGALLLQGLLPRL